MRVRRSLPTSGLSPQGWSDVPTDAPPWTASIAARWTSPWVDVGHAVAGAVVGLAFIGMTLGLWSGGRGLWVVLPAAIAIWALWGAARIAVQSRNTTKLTLTLDPERLTIADPSSGEAPTILTRDRAGWLVADEIGTDWRARDLWLHDDQGSVVARFVGAMARVEIRSRGVPAGPDLPTELPVSVLLGAWWPHPERRMTRQGSLGIRLRWRDPGIAGYPRHERRERAKWSALYLAFAALCLWAATDAATRDSLRLVFGAAGIAIILWRARALRWQPTFVQQG